TRSLMAVLLMRSLRSQIVTQGDVDRPPRNGRRSPVPGWPRARLAVLPMLLAQRETHAAARGRAKDPLSLGKEAPSTTPRTPDASPRTSVTSIRTENV